MAGTMHYKVHEWLKLSGEWWKGGVSYLMVKARNALQTLNHRNTDCKSVLAEKSIEK